MSYLNLIYFYRRHFNEIDAKRSMGICNQSHMKMYIYIYISILYKSYSIGNIVQGPAGIEENSLKLNI